MRLIINLLADYVYVLKFPQLCTEFLQTWHSLLFLQKLRWVFWPKDFNKIYSTFEDVFYQYFWGGREGLVESLLLLLFVIFILWKLCRNKKSASCFSSLCYKIAKKIAFWIHLVFQTVGIKHSLYWILHFEFFLARHSC